MTQWEEGRNEEKGELWGKGRDCDRGGRRREEKGELWREERECDTVGGRKKGRERRAIRRE